MVLKNSSQLFTVDLLLALVPLTIVLGLSANAMSGLTSQVLGYSEWYSHNARVNNALEVLIKTPGEPPNWSASYPPQVPAVLGLANYTADAEPYVLDDRKVGMLNYSVGGTPLYQLAIPRLLGGNFSYYNLTFAGATENTSNLSISFASGSRGEVSSIYAAQRLAMFELEKIVNRVDEISRLSGENLCYEAGGGVGAPKIYYMSFTVGNGDLSSYDYWLVGEKEASDNVQSDAWLYDSAYVFSQPGNITDCSWITGTPDYNIFPIQGSVANCTCPSTDECREDDTLHKINIDASLSEGVTYYVFIQLGGVPSTSSNYYIMRVPRDTCNLNIKPEYGGFKPVTVTLEVGR